MFLFIKKEKEKERQERKDIPWEKSTYFIAHCAEGLAFLDRNQMNKQIRNWRKL